MSIAILPKLSQIFPNESYGDLNEILDGCPSEFVLLIASEINTRLFQRNAFDVEEKLFYDIVNQEGILNRSAIHTKYIEFKRGFKGHTLAIFPLINVLKLMENELQHFREADKYPNPENELKVLKALLYLNEEVDKEHIIKKTSNTFHLLWSSAIKQYEFRIQKNFETELYLSFSLFTFYKNKYPEYYKKFLSHFNCKSEIQYLKGLVELFINAWSKEDGKLHCLFPKDIEEKNQTIKPFVIDLNTYDCIKFSKPSNSYPFKKLREKPIIKLTDGSYLVLNWNFIIDKFRQGLFFDFYNLSGLKNDGVRFEDYKSQFGKEFSEKELFVNTMNSLFENDEIIKRWEQKDKKWNFDYYFRFENKILLFEFKDILMADSVKGSSGEEIEKYISENFIENSDGDHKGITQLMDQILEIQNNQNYVEDYSNFGYQIENLFVFPIIVFTDNTFSFPFINFELSTKFREEINKVRLVSCQL